MARQIAASHLDLVHLVDLEEVVDHVRDGLGVARDLVEHRVGEVALHESVDRAVEGRGEQQRLVRAVNASQHPLDLGHEAHVGHPVGLVQDEDVEVLHGELAAVAKVDESARGRDDDLAALAELADLPLDVGAAVDRGDRGRALAPAARAPRRPARASSRVGKQDQPGRPCGWPGALDAVARGGHQRWSIGRPKASVLPDPVLALPQTSRPASASLMVSAWIGKRW